ncbi:MAG: type 1 glutamine amidotransferase [Phycisphaerae bacterium]|nr:type 1 glutamine amidotransferase [Phycisphaerae bacterium]
MGKLTGKKIAVLLDKEYQELEVWYPYYRMKEEGAEVVLVAPEAKKEYLSKLGYSATSQAAADKVRAGDFHAVIIPGGWAPDFMRRSDAMVNFVRDAAKAGIVLAAICHGGWMLCCTDALRGRKATSFMAIRFDMVNAGATWVDEEVVVDGSSPKIITSRKPSDLPAFCQAIIQALL